MIGSCPRCSLCVTDRVLPSMTTRKGNKYLPIFSIETVGEVLIAPVVQDNLCTLFSLVITFFSFIFDHHAMVPLVHGSH